MKIGIIGTGMVGQVLAEKLESQGHEVMMGTRDVAATESKTGVDNMNRPAFGDWHKDHPEIQLGTFAAAASHGAFIINATNGRASLQALESAGEERLSGKTVLDVANPLDFSNGFPPSLSVCNTDSLGEQIQKQFPDAHVVKGLNTMNAYLMVNPNLLQEDHHVFICGNEPSAKQEVTDLLESFGWKKENVLDLGDITNARGTEQMLPIWVRLYATFQKPVFNFKIVFGED